MDSLSPARPDAVVRGRGEEEDERGRSAQQGDVVDVALGVTQVTELTRETDSEQEAEQDLGAGNQRSQLFQELAVLALEPFLQLLLVLFLLDARSGLVGISHRLRRGRATRIAA
ncbi:MAG: hypothetical protein H0W35_04730 [Actinobacteria bacterium]|nr:hypothetical protein [Actinomycetota bacterium]